MISRFPFRSPWSIGSLPSLPWHRQWVEPMVNRVQQAVWTLLYDSIIWYIYIYVRVWCVASKIFKSQIPKWEKKKNGTSEVLIIIWHRIDVRVVPIELSLRRGASTDDGGPNLWIHGVVGVAKSSSFFVGNQPTRTTNSYHGPKGFETPTLLMTGCRLYTSFKVIETFHKSIVYTLYILLLLRNFTLRYVLEPKTICTSLRIMKGIVPLPTTR